MRSAGNFSPEWGYLAPAPSFARTARVVLVATAIGATAGAGVVLSLIDRPAEPEKTPVAARAIVTSVRAAAVPSVAPAAPATVTAPVKLPLPPDSVAAAAPNDKSDTATRASARAMPQGQAAKPVANSATPTPSSPAVSPSTTVTPGGADAAVTASAPTTADSPTTEPPKVVDAAPTNAPDNTTIMAPEQAAPPKKAKHHANKNAPFPGIGSIFRRMFASHGGRSYYPNSQ